MLLVKYLVQDYYTLQIELRCDIYNAIKEGYEQGLLSLTQVYALVYYAQGYTLEEISTRLETPSTELLVAALNYIEEKTQYTDYAVMRKYKGKVEKQWMAKAKHVSETEW